MNTDATTREFLSFAEVALKLGLSAPTIRRRIAEGSIPSAQPGGPNTAVLVPVRALENLEAHAVGGPR